MRAWSWMRRTAGWPLPATGVLVPAALIVTIVLGSTWGMLSWRVAEWVRTSYATHEQLVFAGPVAAAAAFFSAARMSSGHNMLSLASSVRVGAPTVARQYGMLASWFTGAYAVALVPLQVDTAVRATAGAPDPLAIGSGLLGMAAVVALGYTLGVLLPRPLLVPGVALLVFLLLQLPNYTVLTWAAVVPVQSFFVDLGRVENPVVGAYRVVFLGVLCGCLLLAAARLLASRSVARPWAGASAFGWLALPLALALLPFVRPPDLLAYADTDEQAACRTTGGVEVCVHAGHVTDLPALTRITEQLVDAYGGSPANLRRVYDIALAGTNPSRDEGTAWVYIYPYRPLTGQPATELALFMAGSTACDGGPSFTPSDPEQASPLLLRTIASWLLVESGIAPSGENRVAVESVDFFARASRDEVQTWIAANENAIADCMLNRIEVP